MKKVQSLRPPSDYKMSARSRSRHRQRLDAAVLKHIGSTDESSDNNENKNHDHGGEALDQHQHMKPAYDGEQVEIKLTPDGSFLLSSQKEDSGVSVTGAAGAANKKGHEAKKGGSGNDTDTETVPSCDDDDNDDSFDENDTKRLGGRGYIARSCFYRFRPYLLISMGVGLVAIAVIAATIGASRNWFASSSSSSTNPLHDVTYVSDIVLTSRPTAHPTRSPTFSPTSTPTANPTDLPTPMPTTGPTDTPTKAPSPSPTHPPTAAPVTSSPTVPPFELNPNSVLEYDPATGLYVAPGLSVRSIGKTGQSIPFTSRRAREFDSGTCTMHAQPDGAATFQDPIANDDGGFHYCSNSEDKDVGGVYCVVFDEDCEVRDYVKRFGGTDTDGCGVRPGGLSTAWNCNGGKTPWGTWVSCEEKDWEDMGYCWQVDPYGRRDPQRIERIGTGKWEAMATDDRYSVPVFYFTEDHKRGALRKFTPSWQSVPAGWDTLHPSPTALSYYAGTTGNGVGTLEFLVFQNEGTSGTFYWSTDIDEGRRSQAQNYPNLEGVAFAEVDGRPILFFVSKELERLFILYLEKGTWESRSTNAADAGGGIYKAQPDTIMFLGSKWLFHNEDGGSNPGVYVQNVKTDSYYTIFEDRNPWDGEETTGLATSPDGRCLISCLQEHGECYVVTRDDGGGFELAEQRRLLRL